MLVHCPHCDARAFLVDHGVILRPACYRCARPLPMPGALADDPPDGPMSSRPDRRRGRRSSGSDAQSA